MEPRSGAEAGGGIAGQVRQGLMRKHKAFAALALVLLTPGGQASAGVLDPAQAEQMELESSSFTCPLGGERFLQVVGFPHFPLETFPDGSHLGDQWVDMQIPECPDNGLLILPDLAATEVRDQTGQRGEQENLLVYYNYTPEELALLPGLMASPEWQGLLGQTRSLRAWWLATQLGRPPRDRFDLLQWAGWGTENADQRTSSLEANVQHMPGLIDALEMGEEQRGFYRYFVINAYRELGRFDEALALLEEIESATPGVAMPLDPDSIFGPGDYASPLRQAIAAGDTDRYAIDLLSDDMAGRLCGDSETFGDMRGANTAARCTAREQRMAQWQAESDAVYALLEDRPALTARCAVADGGKRDATLAEACRMQQHEIDWAAGSAYVDSQPGEAAAMCQVTPEDQRDTVQTSACSSYGVYLDYAIAGLLVKDLAAFDLICDAETTVGIGPFASACTIADTDVRQAQARRLWSDKAALRRRCRTELPRENRFDGLDMACGALEDVESEPYWLDDSSQDGDEPPSPIRVAAMPYARQMIADELAARNQQ